MSASFDDCLNWVNWPSDADPEVASLDTSDKHKSLEAVNVEQATNSLASLPQGIESKEKRIQVAGRSISSILAPDEDQMRKTRGRPRKRAANSKGFPSPKKARTDTAARNLKGRLSTPSTMSETGQQMSMPRLHQSIASLPGGGRDSRSPEEARLDLADCIFKDLEGDTPLGDPIVNGALQILADLAPCTVTLIGSLAHNTPTFSQSRIPDPTRALNTKPTTLIPIHTAEPEASWLLAVLSSNDVRVLDAMPADSHIKVVKERIQTQICDHAALLKSIRNEECVSRASSTNTGVSVVIYAIQAIMDSCGVEVDTSSTTDFTLWRAVVVRILKAASSSTHDLSWDNDLEPHTVTRQGGRTKALWSPGNSSGLFDVRYDMAKEEINVQIQHLQNRLGDLESAKRDRDEARAREIRMLHIFRGILANLMEATAQQTTALARRTVGYEKCLNILTEIPWVEEDQLIISYKTFANVLRGSMSISLAEIKRLMQ